MSIFSDVWQSTKSTFLGQKPQAVIQPSASIRPYQEEALQTGLTGLTNAPTTNDTFQRSLAGLEALGMGKAAGDKVGGDNATNSFIDALQGRPSLIDSTYQAKVADPLLRQFREQIAPQIRASFAGPGLKSSDLGGAQFEAERALVEQLTRSRAEMQFAAEEAAKNRMLAAREQAAGEQQQQTATLAAVLEAALNPTQLNLQRLQALVAGGSAGTIDTVGIGLPGTSGLLQNFTAGLGQGLGSKVK